MRSLAARIRRLDSWHQSIMPRSQSTASVELLSNQSCGPSPDSGRSSLCRPRPSDWLK
jgi:hypothetical protein